MSRQNKVKIVSSPWRSLSVSDALKAKALLANIISRLDFVTDWRLQKTYFLSEVWSIEERLRRLSAVDFASWTHGPWSLHIREAIEALEAAGVVTRDERPARRRSEAEFLRITKLKDIPAISDRDIEFLDSVMTQIKFLDGETLTKISKATPPYIAARPRQMIDLDAYLEDLKRKHSKLAHSPKVAALIAEAKEQ